jgi:DNA polymerase III delta prime subunit
MSVDLLFAEKYRPKTLDEMIISDDTRKMIRDSIKNGDIPNMILHGAAGTGKTSVCKVIANELNADLMYINASMERSIDVIRDRVTSFSSTVSLSGGHKIVLFDEADGLTQISQNSLKGVVEEFTSTRFFFTTNHINKIIDPIKSRCVNISFKIGAAEKPKLASNFFKRVCYILDQENIKYQKQVVAELVTKFFPDFRRTLNELQRYSSSGEIDVGILVNSNEQSFKDLFSAMKEKDFTSVRKWVGAHSDVDPQILFREFYDSSFNLFEPQCIPQIILILSDYGYKSTHSVDIEILIAAFCVEVMVTAQWK